MNSVIIAQKHSRFAQTQQPLDAAGCNAAAISNNLMWNDPFQRPKKTAKTRMVKEVLIPGGTMCKSTYERIIWERNLTYKAKIALL